MANFNQKPGETAQAYYKRLAKTADQRLVRLEALSYEKGFKSVKTWAYAGAIQDIRKYTPEGTRFNVKVETRDLPDRIADVRKFLEKPSSNKRNIVKFYAKRADSINRSQGTSYTWQELADFFETTTASKLKIYGSGDTLRVNNAINKGMIKAGEPVEGETKKEREKRQINALKKALDDNNVDNILHVDDDHVKDTIIDMLKNNDLKPEDIFK